MNTTDTTRPVTLLIAAMGGEGGGVLTSWIVNAARSCGLPVQATSIPGVAQRTGATTYYIEIWPEQLAPNSAKPVLALAPAIGEVDILAATEFVETARMIEAGFVTPDRTTLIASNHRVYTTHEKVAMGDGRADLDPVRKAVRERTRNRIVLDMRAAASESGAVINAVMLGTISGAGVLPIQAETFEAGIQAEGKAVEANLRGFQAGLAAATSKADDAGHSVADPARSALTHTVNNDFPHAAHATLEEAVTRLIDYQDVAYAELYLQRLESFAQGEQSLLISVARHLAVRMAYEDIYRVAQVKVRPERLIRIQAEAGLKNGETLRVTEFFKPRLAEIADALPTGLGRWLQGFAQRRPGLSTKSWPMMLETTSVSGFLRLRLLAGLRGLRRKSLRFGVETAGIEDWLGLIKKAAAVSHDVAVEVSECAGLIKGYGDTHGRGMGNYSEIFSQLIRPAVEGNKMDDVLATEIAAARTAALADPEGHTLATALGRAA